jgi:hypothetical protein
VGHELTPEAIEHIQRLSHRIALKKQLDVDERHEIEGHIEDKVLAYLDGEETMTESDAMLLAEAHFVGDPRKTSVRLTSNKTAMEVTRSFELGFIPYGFATILVGASVAVIGNTLLNADIHPPAPYAAFVLPVILFGIAAVALAFEKRSRAWAETLSSKQLSSKQLLPWTLFGVLGFVFFSPVSLQLSLSAGVLGRMIEEGTARADMTLLFLILLTTSFLFHWILSYRCIAWCASSGRAVVALGATVAWYVIHFSTGIIQGIFLGATGMGQFSSVGTWYSYFEGEENLQWQNTLEAGALIPLADLFTQPVMFKFFLFMNGTILLGSLAAFMLWSIRHRDSFSNSNLQPLPRIN